MKDLAGFADRADWCSIMQDCYGIGRDKGEMNKDQLRHKCGYCGKLISLKNFFEHECFKCCMEDEDHVCVDENYVVTICSTKTAEGPACKDTLDELLIGAVKERRALYDYTIPASQRTNLRKNALWSEVSNFLGGALGPEEAKARWKYLRDNYAKAYKKAKAYIPSGSAAQAGGLKKSKFRFYDLMTFLNDFLETRQTVSSMPDVTESQVYATPMQYEDDSVALSSTSTYIPSWMQTAIHASPTMQTPIRVSPETSTLVSPRTSTKDSVSPETSPALSKTLRIPATYSKRLLQTADYDLDEPRQTAAKKKQKSEDLQAALIQILKDDSTAEQTQRTIDPLDGFLSRLGEGMRRLPYHDRSRLEIRILTLLAETEDSCQNK